MPIRCSGVLDPRLVLGPLVVQGGLESVSDYFNYFKTEEHCQEPVSVQVWLMKTYVIEGRY